MKILLVEDHVEILEMMQMAANMYYNEEVVVDIASDGQEALDKCMVNYYDFIITDIDMPVMKGDEMIEKLKKHYTNHYNKIYVLSGAMANEELKNKVDRYFIKPTDMIKILKQIDEDYEKV